MEYGLASSFDGGVEPFMADNLERNSCSVPITSKKTKPEKVPEKHFTNQKPQRLATAKPKKF